MLRVIGTKTADGERIKFTSTHPSLEKDDAEPKNNGTPEKGKNPGATRHMQTE